MREAPNRGHELWDFIELATRATARDLGPGVASHARPDLLNADKFHHDLHNGTPARVYEAFQSTHADLLRVARALHWLDEPVTVTIDRHNEPN